MLDSVKCRKFVKITNQFIFYESFYPWWASQM